METLYWFVVLGNLHKLCVFTIMLAITCVVIYIVGWGIGNADDLPNCVSKNVLYLGLFLGGLCIVGLIFIPTTEELCAIYGAGTIIDFAANDSIVQQLPHDVVNTIHEYLSK